jgi:hypothetical protein
MSITFDQMFSEAKLPRALKSKPKRVSSTLHAYDMDETLFKHDHDKLKIGINDPTGKRVRDLTNQEYNSYKLEPGHKFDFSDFRKASKLYDTASPNKAMIKDLKRKVRRKKQTEIVTARDDFDDKQGVIDFLGKYGINANRGKVHIRRVGRRGQDHPAIQKRAELNDLIAQRKHKKVHMYDDAVSVLKGVKGVEADNPGVKVKTHLVKPDPRGIVRGRPFREQVELAERKRDQIANAVLAAAFAANVASSPAALVNSGKVESPGIAAIIRMKEKRKKADANLDNERVNKGARNKVEEEFKSFPIDKVKNKIERQEKKYPGVPKLATRKMKAIMNVRTKLKTKDVIPGLAKPEDKPYKIITDKEDKVINKHSQHQDSAQRHNKQAFKHGDEYREIADRKGEDHPESKAAYKKLDDSMQKSFTNQSRAETLKGVHGATMAAKVGDNITQAQSNELRKSKERLERAYRKESMNFTQFVESIQNPRYVSEAKDPKCPEGFVWDKDANCCVPSPKTRKGGGSEQPPNTPQFGIWGHSGVNGDGYALAEPPNQK